MRRAIIGITLAGLATTAVLAISLGWAALGPELTKACPAPAIRPVGPDWSLTGSLIGGLNGPGTIRGSRVTWERAATPSAPRRRLDVYLSDALDGELGQQANVRGQQGFVGEGDWPEPGTTSVWWDGGDLGCTIYSVQLSGPGVTEAEALAEADALR